MKWMRAAALAASACIMAAAFAQGAGPATPTAPTAACPRAADMSHLHLYGLWRAEFTGLAQGATLLFEKHPEYAQSVRGGINRDGAKGLLAGDVEDGELWLDESADGSTISANWTGKVVDNSCGKEIRGTWTNAAGNITHAFVLRKVPGWQ